MNDEKLPDWEAIEIALLDIATPDKPSKEWPEIQKQLIAQKRLMVELERRKLLATMAAQIATPQMDADRAVTIAKAILAKVGL